MNIKGAFSPQYAFKVLVEDNMNLICVFFLLEYIQILFIILLCKDFNTFVKY